MKRRWADTRRVFRSSKEARGISLILVMLAMLVLSVLAAAIVFTARAETLASYNWKLDTQADYLAKAGIQYAVNWLRSSRYQTVPVMGGTYTPDQVYQAKASGGTYNTYTSNTSPVQCLGTSGTGCSAGAAIQFITIPSSSGSTTYPNGSVTSGVNVVSNFDSDFPSTGKRISDVSGQNSGVVYVNMVLLSYRTVEQGTPPMISPYALETWKITSRAYWTGLNTTSGSNAVAIAEEESVIQPIYVPNWANAMYGFCSASMGGSAGVCTDAFNSALGGYAGGSNATAASGCDAASAVNVIDAGAGVGANGYVSLTSGVSVAGNVTIGANPTGGSDCCSGTNCGFQGSTSGVLGQVVSGPNIPPPATPTFPPNLGSASDPSFPGGTSTYVVSCNVPTLVAASSGGSLDENLYYYVVTALGAWGESAETESSVYVDLGGSTTPSGKVTVTWSAVSGATSYRVYRGTASGNENVYYSVATPTVTFADTGAAGASGTLPGGIAQWPVSATGATVGNPTLTLKSGTLNASTPYYYVVTALTNGGELAGHESTITTGSTGGSKGVAVSWSAPTGLPPGVTVSGYRIYRGTTLGGPYNGYLGTGTSGGSGGSGCSPSPCYLDKGKSLTLGQPPSSYVNPWTTFSKGTGANPPFFGCTSPPCTLGSSCDGTAANPFQLNSVSMSNGSYLELVGGKDIFHPVYYDMNDLQETGGSIIVSGYIVLNIQNSLKIAGNGAANPIDYQSMPGIGFPVNVPPECVQIIYTGTNPVKIDGNGAVSATIMAPNATVTLGGGGFAGYMVGAIQALNVSLQGGYPLHYDIQLSKAGGVVGVITPIGYVRKKM